MIFCKDNTCFKDGKREKRGRRKIIVGAMCRGGDIGLTTMKWVA
jgi:ribosome-associated protein YbcJ (S4-like RNA binding protein)